MIFMALKSKYTMENYKDVRTHYCWTPYCEGNKGFGVRYVGYSSSDEPVYPSSDACPYCGASISYEPIDWEEAIGNLLDELPKYLANTANKKKLATLILRELESQFRDSINGNYARN